MCRLLCVKSQKPIAVSDYLKKFAVIAKNSSEFQGHGWGYAIHDNSGWRYYHNINPIWAEKLDTKETGNILLVHARSAFENKDIKVENNMPFVDGNNVYIFNGELRGVRIREQGRIGAEKIYNFFKRFNSDSMDHALKSGIAQLAKRTKYIKALNMIVTDSSDIFVLSHFNENPDYYTLFHKRDIDNFVICSQPLDSKPGWTKMPQGVRRLT